MRYSVKNRKLFKLECSIFCCKLNNSVLTLSDYDAFSANKIEKHKTVLFDDRSLKLTDAFSAPFPAFAGLRSATDDESVKSATMRSTVALVQLLLVQFVLAM